MTAEQGSPISRAEAASVLNAYNIGRVLFTRAGAGTANPAAIVVTDKGEFFLKRRNPRYASKDQLAYDHAVIRHLAKAGVPVTPPICTRAGSRWLHHEESVYEVYPLVAGDEHQTGSVSEIEAAGRALARFHRATQSLEPGGDKRLRRLHAPAGILEGLNWARNQLASGVGSAHGGIHVVNRLIRVAQEVRARLPDAVYWALPQCIVHGDYHPANLKFADDEVAGIFDFDWVGRAPRTVDVADGLIYFCGVRERPVDSGDIASITQSFKIDRSLVRPFGRGYAGAIELHRDELRALPDLLRARWLFSRVDAMQRKVPEDQKLDYLLEDIETPLLAISKNSDWLSAGTWLAGR